MSDAREAIYYEREIPRGLGEGNRIYIENFKLPGTLTVGIHKKEDFGTVRVARFDNQDELAVFFASLGKAGRDLWGDDRIQAHLLEISNWLNSGATNAQILGKIEEILKR